MKMFIQPSAIYLHRDPAVFCSKQRNKLRRLYWNKTFILWYKLLEKDKFKWPGQSDDAKYTFQSVNSFGVDYIHTTELSAKESAFKGGLSLSAFAKKYADVPIIANGSVNSEDDAKLLIDSNQADIISLGKIALANQNWPNVIKDKKRLNEFSFDMFNPIADLKTAKEYLAKNF